MTKDPSRERGIVCRYNPTEVGQYVLHLQWSGVHVPGSPHTVTLVDTQRELDLLPSNPIVQSLPTASTPSSGPLIIGGGSGGGGLSGCADFDGVGTLRMSTLSGDGLIFTDDN